MSTPIKLYVFKISHYCEKARWALDYLNINYQLIHLAPGSHIKKAQSMGLHAASVPILDTGEQIIQGSARIIDWAENFNTQRKSVKTLAPLSLSADCAAIEDRLDNVIGVHIRRWFYSEALVEFPKTVLPIFTKDLRILQKFKLRVIWPQVRKIMIKKMDLGYEQGLASQAIVETELEWLESLPDLDSPYLAGDFFSRADLTAASLIMPFLGIKDSPQAAYMVLPPRFESVTQRWSDRPITKLIKNVYNKFR